MVARVVELRAEVSFQLVGVVSRSRADTRSHTSAGSSHDHIRPLNWKTRFITDTTDVEIVGEAGTGAEAVQLTEDLHPDVVVMDIRMPGMDGIEATRLITTGPGNTRVIVLTTFDDDYIYARGNVRVQVAYGQSTRRDRPSR